MPQAITCAWLCVTIAVGALGVGVARAVDAPTLEYQVKASYLYNFVRFIDWPSEALADAKFNLCVVGAERFGSALEQLHGARLEGREIALRRLERAAGARAARCHVLFIGGAEAGAAPVLAARGLLTVGESPGFVERGGIINLVEVRGRIRFEINQEVAQQSGLIISSRLLDLAMQQR